MSYAATITGLVPGTTYVFTVQAVDAQGVIGPAVEISYYHPVLRGRWGVLTEADMLAILGAIGHQVAVNNTTIIADFRLRARNANLYTGEIESTGPTCRVSCGQLIDNGIIHGTQLTAQGVTYYVRGIDEEPSGFALLTLSRE